MSTMAIGCTTGRVALAALVALGALAVAASAGAGSHAAPGVEGDVRYEMSAVRVEHASSAFVYRLDRHTGEVCAFAFGPQTAGAPRGCVPGGEGGPPSVGAEPRFTLQALQGPRGTHQSSAYRLDRATGEICRFRLPATSEARLERVDCANVPPAPGAEP